MEEQQAQLIRIQKDTEAKVQELQNRASKLNDGLERGGEENLQKKEEVYNFVFYIIYPTYYLTLI